MVAVARLCWFLPVAVAVVTVVIFARLVRCDFTAWDDPQFIANNRRLQPPSAVNLAYYWTTVGERTPGQLYTPMAYTVWSAVAAVAGVHPGPFHALNVVLHATTAALACVLLRQLTGRPWAAAAGALLFAVHPAQVESVGWAAGTKDVLCGLLAIASLSAHVAAVRSARRGRRRALYAAATGLFALAMASKPTAIVVPLMAFTIDTLILGRRWKSAALWLWPWAVLMVPCGLIARAAQPAPWASPVPVWSRPLIATDAVAWYVGHVAWPAHLGVDYGRRPTTVYASGAIYWTWLVPAAIAVAVRRRPLLLAAAVLFVLPLVPVLGLVPFDFQFYSTTADHYLYLPLLGAALLVTAALEQLPGRTTLACLATTALALRTVTLEPTWQSTESVFAHALAVNPRSFVSCDFLGGVEAVYGADAIRGDRPTVPPTDPRYGQWRADLRAALAWYAAALDRCPTFVPSLINTARYAGELGERDRQRAALRRVVALQPTLPVAMRAERVELVRLLLQAGDPATADRYLAAEMRADPGDVGLMLLRAEVGRTAVKSAGGSGRR